PIGSTGRRARDRAQDQPRPGHDLARAASKRRYPRREAGVPGLGRAVEGGADGAEAEDREAGREPETTELRPGPAQRRCVPSRWVDRGRAGRTGVEGQVEATPGRPAVGHGVESGADLTPA